MAPVRSTTGIRVATALIVAAIGLAISCGGAGREQSPPSAYRLRVVRVQGPARQTESAQVRAAVAEAAATTRWFSAEASEPLEASVRYSVLAGASGAAVLRVEVDVDVLPTLRDALLPRLSATVELSRAEGAIVIARDLPVALERAVAILDAHVTLQRGDDAARAALLVHTDAEIVLLALDWVEGSRGRAFADAVARLVNHRSDGVALRAVECLGVVGGPEHARVLVRHPRLGDPAHANRLYEALANLGGVHALGFLEFAARNEDDPTLASLAQRALARARAHDVGGTGDAVAELGVTAAGLGRGHRHAGEGT